jgi:hypothetical protein
LENKKLLPISIIILSISIMFGAVWVGQSLIRVSNIQVSNSIVSTEKALLTDKESAEYLNISIDEFTDILSKDSKQKEGLTGYPTYEFIPYIEINGGKRMFVKEELDEWIKYKSLNK